MSDFKSKLPDFKEISSMTSKLFKGLKNSIEEIIQDYKNKRSSDSEVSHPKTKETHRTKVHKETKAKETKPKSTEHKSHAEGEAPKKRSTQKHE